MMKSKLTLVTGIAVILFGLLVVPLHAQIGDRDVAAGIESVTGQIARIPAQGSVLDGELSDDSRAFVFIERENLDLDENIRVNISTPGTYDSLRDAQSATISAGTTINSYFVHFNPTGFSPSLPGVQGRISFEQDILGLIVTEGTLDSTTPEVGAPGTNYGNEAGVRFLEESVSISNNRRVFQFDFNNNARFVQLRVITRGTAEDSSGSDSGTPNARADSASTRTNRSVSIDVLANDDDSDNNIDEITLRVISDPRDGSTSIDRDAVEITYDPDNNFTGTDSFVYEICDTTDRCDTATVTVTVSDSGGSDDPVSPNARGDNASTSRNSSVTIDVLDNDTDDNNNIDNDTLRVTSNPDDGTTSVDRDDGTITYDPDNNFSGTDSFVYEICDTTDRCDTATVTITVSSSGSDSATPSARNDSATTDENRSVRIDVLDNDTDSNNNIDRDTLRVTSNPDDGTTSVDRDDGTITYDPDNNFTGTDSFVYEICDTTDRCDTATVTVDVESSGSGGGSGGGGGDVTIRTLLPEADDCSFEADARIDIIPGNRANVIRMDDETGMTPVAILSTVRFPAPNCVDVSTVTFGPTGDELGAMSCGVANVNFDRWPDIVCDFKTSDLEFESGDSSGELQADVVDGGLISESDDVEVVEARRFRSHIPSSSAEFSHIRALQIGRNLFVKAEGAEVSRLSIQVFNSEGKPVAIESRSGSLLRWNMRSGSGATLANGVYIYVVTAFDADGSVIGRSIDKIALIR